MITTNELFRATCTEKINSSTMIEAVANKFEVAPTTIQRWIDGVAVPHPKIQQLVIDFLIS